MDATEEDVAAADGVVLLTDHLAFDYDIVATGADDVLEARRWLPASDSVDLLYAPPQRSAMPDIASTPDWQTSETLRRADRVTGHEHRRHLCAFSSAE